MYLTKNKENINGLRPSDYSTNQFSLILKSFPTTETILINFQIISHSCFPDAILGDKKSACMYRQLSLTCLATKKRKKKNRVALFGISRKSAKIFQMNFLNLGVYSFLTFPQFINYTTLNRTLLDKPRKILEIWTCLPEDEEGHISHADESKNPLKNLNCLPGTA